MVEPRDKSLVIGFTSFLNSLFGWTLGPIIFGRMIDTTCLIWSSSSNNSKGGSCVLYDTRQMKIVNYYTSAGVGFSCAILSAIALYVHMSKENSKKYPNVITVYKDKDIRQ
ncbi:hypothetical protein Ahia01_000554000 [Argonauta hians]